MGPGGFFPTNPDLADILGDTDFDFENLYFGILLDPKFPDFQVLDFQISRNLAWASLGPLRAWAFRAEPLGWAGGSSDAYNVKAYSRMPQDWSLLYFLPRPTNLSAFQYLSTV